MKVILISAKARHGKDLCASILKREYEAQGKRVLITHYADYLKFICKNYFGWDGNKDETGRSILQKVGTTFRDYDENFWVDQIITVLRLFEDLRDIVILSDCRYKNEIEAMKSAFDTTVFRIERTNFDNGLTEEQKQHKSETDLDDYKVEIVIKNDGTIDDFNKKVREVIKEVEDAGSIS